MTGGGDPMKDHDNCRCEQRTNQSLLPVEWSWQLTEDSFQLSAPISRLPLFSGL